jgi:hypothetical protein
MTCAAPGCSRAIYCKSLCTQHYQRLRKHGTLAEPTSRRFWAKVDKSGDHWIWTGARNENGYGRYNNHLAHRLAYVLTHGEIPDGLPLDHVCRVTSCVNPAHLEPVTNGENVLRGYGPNINAARQNDLTHCLREHAFTPENTRRNRNGSRSCRTCLRLRRTNPDLFEATRQPGRRVRIDVGRSVGAALRAEVSLAGAAVTT